MLKKFNQDHRKEKQLMFQGEDPGNANYISFSSVCNFIDFQFTCTLMDPFCNLNFLILPICVQMKNVLNKREMQRK